jgi:hypothetical protein
MINRDICNGLEMCSLTGNPVFVSEHEDHMLVALSAHCACSVGIRPFQEGVKHYLIWRQNHIDFVTELADRSSQKTRSYVTKYDTRQPVRRLAVR